MKKSGPELKKVMVINPLKNLIFYRNFTNIKPWERLSGKSKTLPQVFPG